MIELTSSWGSADKFLLNPNYILRIDTSKREDTNYKGTNCRVDICYSEGIEVYYVKETYEELKGLLCK